MIKVGDMVAHELYVHSKGVVVEVTEKEYVIYYIDGLANDRFQPTPRDRIIKVKDVPDSLVKSILERYQLHLDEIVLKARKVEMKQHILKGISEIIK